MERNVVIATRIGVMFDYLQTPDTTLDNQRTYRGLRDGVELTCLARQRIEETMELF
jgi:hypothetical protein